MTDNKALPPIRQEYGSTLGGDWVGGLRLPPQTSKWLASMTHSGSRSAVISLAIRALYAIVSDDPLAAEEVADELSTLPDFDGEAPRKLRGWARGCLTLAAALNDAAVRLAEALAELEAAS